MEIAKLSAMLEQNKLEVKKLYLLALNSGMLNSLEFIDWQDYLNAISVDNKEVI